MTYRFDLHEAVKVTASPESLPFRVRVHCGQTGEVVEITPMDSPVVYFSVLFPDGDIAAYLSSELTEAS